MQKKQILIVFTDALNLGGIEISLMNLLKSIDYSLYCVDLFLYSHRGVYFDAIPKEVNVLPEVKELSYLRESIWSKIKHGCWDSAYHRICWQLFKNGTLDEEYAKIIDKYVPKFETSYDLAIGFFRPFDILKKVDAKVKAGWIHTDYTVDKSEDIIKAYSVVDYIVAVSESVRESFITATNSYFDQNKVIVVENLCDVCGIREQANAFETDDMRIGTIKLLSIGRFCYQKWFDRIPILCKKLREYGLDVCWYIIGFGKDEDRIEESIKLEGMQDYVRVLGKKDNPYPYIKACDFYVQPSRYEGKSVAVREAQILCKPVIITDYPTASSQVVNGVNGFIVPMQSDECAMCMRDIISGCDWKTVTDNLSDMDFSNQDDLKKVYALCDM